MTVWAENPSDGGSAVWGCSACDGGGWCWDHTSALVEARTHAKGHSETVDIVGAARRGPQPNWARDAQIAEMRAERLTVREIAARAGLSVGGVVKALRRIGTSS